MGGFKSQVLADRLAKSYGRPVGYSVYPFREYDDQPHGHGYPGLPAYRDSLIIGCADNALARKAMAETLPGDPRRWLIDAGNDTNWGQVLVGNVSGNVSWDEPPFLGETCYLAPGAHAPAPRPADGRVEQGRQTWTARRPSTSPTRTPPSTR